MKRFVKHLKIGVVLLAHGIAASVAFADPVSCPTLTASDFTAVVTQNSANGPFDGSTYFWMGTKPIDKKMYILVVDDVYAKDSFEAKQLAEQSLSSGEQTFNGEYNETYKLCVYKQPSSPNDEPIALAAVIMDSGSPQSFSSMKAFVLKK